MSEKEKESPSLFEKFGNLLKKSSLRKKITKKKKGEKSLAEQINFGGKNEGK